ncbi:hypothetical protein NQ318_004823 [Aromia moschata]|uniref:WD repeat-containing protein 65 n=1 Tax=Aromia moschata TaxID=1265417 RepID=A0AAV8Z132_9CUCU|nr:hypothetical protein NQ318_004823 [Aromia moschata]
MHSSTVIVEENNSYKISCLTCFNRGFVFGFTNGVVHLYEKETAHKYIKRGTFVIPERVIRREYDEEVEILTTINAIAINPSQDSVRLISETLDITKTIVHEIVSESLEMRKVCVKLVPKVLTDDQKARRASEGQPRKNPGSFTMLPSHTCFLVADYLVKAGITVVPQPPYSPDVAPRLFLFPRLKTPMKGQHFGSVKNIQMACTDALKAIPKENDYRAAFDALYAALRRGVKDRAIKIWNYETDEVELLRQFEDDIYSVALHPSGLYATIGFSDKLRFMTILIDDITTVKEFSIRTCRMVSFSRMGHLFAAANGNVIEVYCSITFEQMYILKGHSGKITGMSWSYNDRILATCGTEGTVYGWKVDQSARITETIIKSTRFTAVSINREGKNIFAVGVDGHLRELVNSNVHRDVVLPAANVPLDDMVTDGNPSGSLGSLGPSLNIPIGRGLAFITLEMALYYGNAVFDICLSWDDRYLISVARDGSICFWRLLNIEDKSLMYDPSAIKFTEVLIARNALEEKLELIRNLSLRLKEMEAEHTYKMRQKDALHDAKIEELHGRYISAMDELKVKNEQMETDHVQEINNINQQTNKTKVDHELNVQRLEDSYNEKLIAEYEKFHAFEAKMEKMLKESEGRYEQLKKEKADSEEQIRNDFMEQLRDKEDMYEDLLEHSQQEQKKHEVIKQQIEDDADREIYELKEAHEKELKEEQDLNVRVRGEAAAMKKKFLTSQKETDDLKHRLFCMENDNVKFKGIIINLEKEIADTKKEIQERDQTIEDKEKRLYQLKRNNQELEKFKFILDFKIKELKGQIEPKEKTIQEQLHQINDMVRELENLQKVILGLDLQLAEIKEKWTAANSEVKKEISKNRRMKQALQAIRFDIHNASSVIQNVPLLQKTVRDMYHKYNADKDFEITQAEDTEAKSEFLRQREFFRKDRSYITQSGTVYGSSKATKNANALSYDKVRLVEENAALLVETNSLRKNLQSESHQTKKLNALIAATNTEIHNKYKERLEENEKAIAALKEENERLLNKITEMTEPLEEEYCE